MKFNFNNDRPIYIQLVEQLQIHIISGQLKPGEKMPSIRDLAISCRVNPNTLQKALNELEDKKVIYTERTSGKYVTQDNKIIEKLKENIATTKVKTYLTDMESIGFTKEQAIAYLKEKGE